MNMISQIKSLKISSIFLLFCLSLFVTSCTCDEDCAEFSNFRLCASAPVKDGCSSNSNVFSQSADWFTVSVEITHGEPDDRLSLKYFVNNGGSFSEFASQVIALKDIDENLDGSERKIRASTGISRKAGAMWPVGDYKVEIELTQENIPLNATQNFSVQ